MKCFKFYLLFFSLLGMLMSCTEDDEGDDNNEDGPDAVINGLYTGTASMGSAQVGTWIATVYDDLLIGVSTGVDGEVIFEGQVSSSGAVTGTFDITDSDGFTYTTVIAGQIEDGEISGTWSDDEDAGTWKGSKNTEGNNGLYAGTGSAGSTQVATWVATVYDNLLIGVSTGEDGEVIFEGAVTNAGAVSGTFDLTDTDGFVYTTTIEGQIDGDEISGTWSDDEDAGTWEGERVD